ncbi:MULTISPECIES: hypothetical protein [Burkholderia cepacia complex]|uniref:hypothetical protein n=1 Tax=Burkholderia cepacia complex TaxID=87882 RepID=UPI0015892923|nr:MULTISPECIES: hypothetical protein [Burkholderia cepacia complex]MBR8426362.1 hypothetical protein [Burkholderia cenocepacia]MBR8494762.1 hypothetical protein [Burkholderia cenocepacia]MCA8081414.1 hypothetical protein [Burkholderia cepacia]
MTNTAATQPQETCYCVGGPLHGDGLSPFGDTAGLLYRLSHDFPGEPGRQALYRRKSLTRTTDAGDETRDFLVLESVTDPDGKLDQPGLTDDAALDATLAAPERFWK